MKFRRYLYPLAAALFGALLLSEPYFAGAGPFWSSSSAPLPSPNPGPSGSCGTVPTPAVTVGYTTCIFNTDFTQSTGAGWLPYAFGSISSLSWFDNGGTSNAFPWHYLQGRTGAVNIANDGGTQVLDWQYASTDSLNRINSCPNGFNGPCPAALSLPEGLLYETVFRTASNNSAPPCVEGGMYSWTTEASPNATAFNNDWYNCNNNGDQSFGTGVAGDAQPGGLYWAPFNAGSCLTSPCYVNLPGGTAWNGGNTVYHTYDFLLTLNQSYTSYIGCAYFDGVFQSCDSGNNPVDSLKRIWFIIEAYGNPNPSSTAHIYVKWVKAWSCPNYAIDECAGSTIVNSGGSPGLTYWKGAS